MKLENSYYHFLKQSLKILRAGIFPAFVIIFLLAPSQLRVLKCLHNHTLKGDLLLLFHLFLSSTLLLSV